MFGRESEDAARGSALEKSAGNRQLLRQTGILGGQQQRPVSQAVQIGCGSSATVDPGVRAADVVNRMGRRDVGPGIRQESSWAAWAIDLGANAAARRKQRNRQKDQEKRMYSVVESQSRDTSTVRARQSRDERGQQRIETGGWKLG